MVHTCILVKGSAGTGKTRYLKQKITEVSPAFMFLTPYRRNALMARDGRFFNNNNTMTIYGLCYRVLSALGLLPQAFLTLNISDLENLQTKLTSKDFQELFSRFLALADKQIRNVLGNVSAIAADDIQNWDKDSLAVVQKLWGALNHCSVVLAGNSFQRLHTPWRKKLFGSRTDVVGKIAKLFGVEDFHFLNVNRRSSQSISTFLNAFYLKTFPSIPQDFMYQIDSQTFGNAELPELHVFQNCNDEKEFLKGLDDVTIITETNKYRDFLSDKDDPENSRHKLLHKFSGCEAAFVAYAGYSCDSSTVDGNMIASVGLSRAKQRLIITTSFPLSSIQRSLPLNQMKLVDHTSKRTQPFKNNRTVSFEFNSIRRYNRTSIDSMTCYVDLANVPFRPYIKHNVKAKPGPGGARQLDKTPSGVPYTLSKNSTGAYVFDFRDLNPLRSAGYTDGQVVKFIANEILRHFDFRLELKSIEIAKIHLSEVLTFRSEKQRNKFLRDFHEAILNGIPTVHPRTRNNPLPTMTELASLSETNYYNIKPRRKDLTICVYDPEKKGNENKFPDSNYFRAKPELRLNSRAMVRQARYLQGADNLQTFARKLRADKNWAKSIWLNTIGYDPFNKREED